MKVAMRLDRNLRHPQDTRSVRFYIDSTKIGDSDRLDWDNNMEMQEMESLREVFQEWPFQKVPTTPELSLCIITSASWKFSVTSQESANSSATSPAQLISQSLLFQPWIRHQAAHQEVTTNPIPQDENASTHMSGSRQGSGTRDLETFGCERTSCHQVRSQCTVVGR